MAQLVDVDGKTVPVLSRKLRDPHPSHHQWNLYQKLGIKQGDTVWVTMTTKDKLDIAGIKRYTLTQTVDGWEYLVKKADLVSYLRTVIPPFRRL